MSDLLSNYYPPLSQCLVLVEVSVAVGALRTMEGIAQPRMVFFQRSTEYCKQKQKVFGFFAFCLKDLSH